MDLRIPSFRVFFGAFCISLVLSTASVLAQSAERFVPSEVLVKFTGGAESERARTANRRLNATPVEGLGDLGWHRIKIAAGMTVGEAVAGYKGLEGVEAVQPNFYYSRLATPNDPGFAGGMYGMNIISAPAAWDLSTGSSAVVVANIDTGIWYTHQDLAPNSWINSGEIAANGVDDDGNGFIDDVRGWDFFYNDSNPIDDAGGHGTHTSGTIGAAGNNGLSVVGVNWNVKIMAIKIYSPAGTDSTSAMLINAYNYVRMMKNRGVNIRVTNNSYGGCGEACDYDQATKDALDAMGNAGILNVFAAGNSNSDNDQFPHWPSNYTSPSVLSVASSNSSDNKSGFSNWGLVSVDLAAPGSGILSTWSGSNSATNTISGTSMATPHVAGAAALLSAYNPSLSVASLKASLMNSVDAVPAFAGLVKTGGRLNVFRALQNQTVCAFGGTLNVPTKGGTFTVNITPGQNCDGFVKSNVNWIKVVGPDLLSGSGTVTFRVTVNPTITRTGTINIGGQLFTVRQSRV